MMRTTRRFAVCRAAQIGGMCGKAESGLLIELSQDGCRLGKVKDHARFTVGNNARVEIDGFEPFDGEVRWSKDGFVGLAFDRALAVAELDALLLSCRPPAAAA